MKLPCGRYCGCWSSWFWALLCFFSATVARRAQAIQAKQMGWNGIAATVLLVLYLMLSFQTEVRSSNKAQDLTELFQAVGLTYSAYNYDIVTPRPTQLLQLQYTKQQRLPYWRGYDILVLQLTTYQEIYVIDNDTVFAYFDAEKYQFRFAYRSDEHIFKLKTYLDSLKKYNRRHF